MRARIQELDALRGIAALSVVIFHFAMPWKSVQLPFFNVFSMGVDLFFIISGFVIFMTIDRSATWQEFAWNRFARLYPAYWFCVTVTTLLFVFKYTCLIPGEHYRVSGELLRQYLGNMTMVQYYLGMPNIDGPYWTLIIELCFYVLMAVLMVSGGLRYEFVIGWAIAALCGCYALPIVYNNHLVHKLLMLFPLIAYFPLFFGGMVLYQMRSGKVTALKLGAFISTLIFQCLLFKNCHENKHMLHMYQYVPTLIGIYTVLLLFLFDKLAFIINPVTMWLGRISYSLYLFHQFVGIRVLIPQMIERLHISYWLAAPIALVCVVAMAHVINKYIEVPSLNLLKWRAPKFKQEELNMEEQEEPLVGASVKA